MTATTSQARKGGVIAAFAVVYVVWGSTYLAIRYGVETLPPFLMTGVRFLISGAVLYLWARRAAGRPTRRHWISATIIGSLLVVGGNGVVVWVEQWLPSGLTALVIGSIPLWMVLIEWLRPGGVRPTASVTAGLLLGFASVGLLANPSGGDLEPGRLWLSIGALMFATLSWAIGSIYARHAPLPDAPLMTTALEMLGGGAVAMIVGTVLGEWQGFDPAAVSLRSLVAFAYLVVFGSLLAFTCYIWLLKVSTPARVSTYAYVNPIVAVALGWAVAGEEVTTTMLIATVGIVGAVVLINAQHDGRSDVDAAPGDEEPVEVPGPHDECPGGPMPAAARRPPASAAESRA